MTTPLTLLALKQLKGGLDGATQDVAEATEALAEARDLVEYRTVRRQRLLDEYNKALEHAIKEEHTPDDYRHQTDRQGPRPRRPAGV